MSALRFHSVAACLWVTAVVTAVVMVAGTASAQQEFTPVAGGVRYRKIGVYDKTRLATILDRELDTFMAGFDPSQASTMKSTDFKSKFAAPRNGVTLYEVQFNSVIPEWENQPTLGSGLLAVPDDGATSHPLVSYQHGTVFGRDEVPSRPDNSYETRLALAAFASQGYVVIGADYFGRRMPRGSRAASATCSGRRRNTPGCRGSRPRRSSPSTWRPPGGFTTANSRGPNTMPKRPAAWRGSCGPSSWPRRRPATGGSGTCSKMPGPTAGRSRRHCGPMVATPTRRSRRRCPGWRPTSAGCSAARRSSSSRRASGPTTARRTCRRRCRSSPGSTAS